MTTKKMLDHGHLHDLLEKHGLRVTAPRLAVLKLLMAASMPLKAYDIIEKLSRPQKEVKPPTVYRALASLDEAGLVHRLESANAYIFCAHHQGHEGHSCCHGHGQEVLFAICDKCGRVKEIEQALKPSISTILHDIGFDAGRRIFEIRGVCSACQ